MRIEIWSDVVCPWCYIGKRRLESALADFPHRDQVQIVWRSFQLDPSAPTTPTETVLDMLGRKYGAGQDAVDRVEALAAEEGMLFRHGQAPHVNTLDAHRLLHAAGDQRGELKEALLHAYFVNAENVADHDVLTRIATDVGLDEVEADIRQAAAYGATGVPFFVIDSKYGISGAQPVETFAQALDRAWSETHPAIVVIGGADACGPDGCAI